MTQNQNVPIEVDAGRSQLFVDDFLVDEMTSLHRRLNRPIKRSEPVLVADQPWEISGLVYGSVQPHDDAFHFYYKALGRAGLPNVEHIKRFGFGKFPICMARSDDGLTFNKAPVEGSTLPGSNIVLDDMIDDYAILRDDRDPDPSRRYKMLASRGEWMQGLSAAISPDGLKWTFVRDFAVPYLGDRMCYWFDPIRKLHVAWSRDYHAHPMRLIWQVETDNFDCWDDSRKNHPWLALEPDRHDAEDIEFYGGYAFYYQSLYLAYLEVFHTREQRIDTQLCASRDGRTWQRVCNRELFMRNGEHGNFDAYWIVPTFNPPILRNGKLLIHYNGRPDPHARPGHTTLPPGMGGAFGLAELREDGFVSLDATATEGVLTTHLLKPPPGATRLQINACPFSPDRSEKPMQVIVEIVSDNDESIATHTLSDSAAIWQELHLPAPLPAAIRLRFRMINARLYSFRLS